MGKNLKTTFIYYLICPLDNKVKYIGRSSEPINRYINHLQEVESTDKKKWIDNLISIGRRPILKVVQMCAVQFAQEVESEHIVLNSLNENFLFNIYQKHESLISKFTGNIPYFFQGLLKTKCLNENKNMEQVMNEILSFYFKENQNYNSNKFKNISDDFIRFKNHYESINENVFLLPKKLWSFFLEEIESNQLKALDKLDYYQKIK